MRLCFGNVFGFEEDNLPVMILRAGLLESYSREEGDGCYLWEKEDSRAQSTQEHSVFSKYRGSFLLGGVCAEVQEDSSPWAAFM